MTTLEVVERILATAAPAATAMVKAMVARALLVAAVEGEILVTEAVAVVLPRVTALLRVTHTLSINAAAMTLLVPLSLRYRPYPAT